MTPELLEIDGQLFVGIVREDADDIASCSCCRIKDVRSPDGFRFVPVEMARVEQKPEPFSSVYRQFRDDLSLIASFFRSKK